MFVNGLQHHNEVRAELIRLYKVMTQHLFTIIAPRSVFLTTEQLEVIEKNPPMAGIALFSTPIETQVTIEKIINAYLLGGDGFQMGFRYPRKELPIIYETLQDAVRLWTDIKLNSYNFKSAPMEELEAMELVARNLFEGYRIYHNERVKNELAVKERKGEDRMMSIYLNILHHGMDEPDEVSFISYVDLYRAKNTGISNYPGNYAKRKLSIDDIPAAQPRQFDMPKKGMGLGNWLND